MRDRILIGKPCKMRFALEVEIVYYVTQRSVLDKGGGFEVSRPGVIKSEKKKTTHDFRKKKKIKSNHDRREKNKKKQNTLTGTFPLPEEHWR